MDNGDSLSARAAEEIRAMLGRKRVTGRELARRLDVSSPWVSQRLTGHTEIGLNDLELIAAALDVEVSDLLPSPSRRDERTSGRINERSSSPTVRTRPELLHTRPPTNRTAHSDHRETVKSPVGDSRRSRPSWTCDGVTA